jgi:hypothetical protein
MDDIQRDDIRRALATPPATKALQALETMADGIELKRISLRLKHPELDDIRRDALLRAWLLADD